MQFICVIQSQRLWLSAKSGVLGEVDGEEPRSFALPFPSLSSKRRVILGSRLPASSGLYLQASSEYPPRELGIPGRDVEGW